MRICVKDSNGTYNAKVDGTDIKASCTASPAQAAARAACKAFNLAHDEVEVAISGGDRELTWYTAKPTGTGARARANMSFEELFDEVICGKSA
ncbi:MULTISPECIES: hypothetical protein [Pseudohongiella]|uniref:Uncharacterized protein n=1 Tax=marine sediment metagenome TaxID=412755 RepID=A0A0F9YQB0_9ZZZZ|nr:hypothetical protein [Pseudohongiella sp.]HDZ10057.1 hypothetical protein [Pseudohongiella sp.]HEA63406.1 hypothetical protein [Pseudohongiella sp.]|tara:strand:+ start:313 stop:591 length:279 start_codon:yes stop_codon:yes gene_type:complete